MGHGGRGGWSWHTGSAARMLSAAYELLGIEQSDGQSSVRPDLFEPKSDLAVETLRVGDEFFSRDGDRVRDEVRSPALKSRIAMGCFSGRLSSHEQLKLPAPALLGRAVSGMRPAE